MEENTGIVSSLMERENTKASFLERAWNHALGALYEIFVWIFEVFIWTGETPVGI